MPERINTCVARGISYQPRKFPQATLHPLTSVKKECDELMGLPKSDAARVTKPGDAGSEV